MRFDPPSLLKAIDSSEGLRRHLDSRAPDAMRMIRTFRKRMGDGCSYVHAALRMVWHQEVVSGTGDTEPHLRAAGYPS